jgi:ABC-2 type transport system permease protein
LSDAEPHLHARGTAQQLRLADASSTFGTPGDFNLVGLWTLYLKEVRRFIKVMGQTLIAPIITTLVFLAIFTLALGRAERMIEGLPFLEFLAPGLAMMAIVQNSFANTSSSLMIAKIQGNIVDYLMPPLAPGELLFGMAMGGVTRGLIVGCVVFAAMLPFVHLPMVHPLLVLFYIVAASLMLSLLGILAALWAEKFDQMAMVTNFVITPLSFLSGTFYSIRDLPEPFHLVALLNPFFYMIDGVRYGVTGHSDGSVLAGAICLVLVNLALWRLALHLFRVGYRLKA